MPNNQLEKTIAPDSSGNQQRSKQAPAIEKAKAKTARLRLMKERNENYLAEREGDEDLDIELRVSDSN